MQKSTCRSGATRSPSTGVVVWVFVRQGTGKGCDSGEVVVEVRGSEEYGGLT